MNESLYIGEEDAAYVQVLYTSTVFGTKKYTGIVNIIAEYKSNILHFVENHELAYKLLVVIARKRYFLLAARNITNAEVIKRQEEHVIPTIVAKNDQCVVGMYSKFDPKKTGTFRIKIPHIF